MRHNSMMVFVISNIGLYFFNVFVLTISILFFLYSGPSTASARSYGSFGSGASGSGFPASDSDSASASGSTSRPSSLWFDYDDLVTTNQGQQNADDSESFQDEIKMYLAEPARKEVCPLTWWKSAQVRLPKLSRIARALLAIPATSVNSERLNSTSGNIVTTKRCNLLSEHVAELTFIHENL